MKTKVLVIAGPTAVGKTSCSIDLAKQFHGEIISGDAMQVYQGFDIGTAKIINEEMQGVTHHLIDCLSYHEAYHVKMFQEKARVILDEIKQRGHLPMVCGGTGLYIKSLLYDYEFVDQERDESFLKFLATLSNDQLYALLTHVDRVACESIHPHNRQRMIRAVEMAHSGKRKSDVIQAQAHELLYDAFIVGLTMERDHLYERINQRVDMMMAQGLYEEVVSLVEKDEKIWESSAFQSIGYKEWKAHFIEGKPIVECVEQIKKNSRNFAKRQYTWFRNQMPMHWYDVEEAGWKERLNSDVKAWLNDAQMG